MYMHVVRIIPRFLSLEADCFGITVTYEWMLNKIHRFIFFIIKKKNKPRNKRARCVCVCVSVCLCVSVCVCVHYFSCGVQARALRRRLSRRASWWRFSVEWSPEGEPQVQRAWGRNGLGLGGLEQGVSSGVIWRYLETRHFWLSWSGGATGIW